MITNEEYQKAIELIKKYKQQCLRSISEIDNEIDPYNDLRNTLLIHSDLSRRTINILVSSRIGLDTYSSKVKDLANISFYSLKEMRGIGVKRINEIGEICKQLNIIMLP